MNHLLTLDTNLVEDMIAPKVIELRKEKTLYELFKIIPAIQECYFDDIFNHMIYRINNVIDGGFAKKYECTEAEDEGNPLDINFIDYDGSWHIEHGGGLKELEEYCGMLITTKYGKYLMLHFQEDSNKINKFKCNYKDCFKIEWLNGYDLEYNSDSDDE